MRRLQTSTLNNQNISTYLLAATYTADADRALLVAIAIDQVVGNGDYYAYITRQIAGAGSEYMIGPITTFSVPNGQTSIAFSSIILPAENTDVIKCYVKGLPGDNANPDIITRFYELTYLRPTTAGRTLDVAATGEAGLDFDNVKQATAPTTLTNITVPTTTTLTNPVTLANGAHGGAAASLTLAVPLATQASVSAIATILSGITSLANWLRGLARKDAMNGVAKAELNAGGGAFDEATDSQEAIADAIVPGAPINIVVDETDIVVNP